LYSLRKLIAAIVLVLPLHASSQQPVSSPKAQVTNPHGPLALACENCHASISWKPIRSNPEFNHDQTGYPLRGMHEKVGCTQCHTSMIFKKRGHQLRGLPCRHSSPAVWRQLRELPYSQRMAMFHWMRSASIQNRFPLVGAHALVECEGCHKGAATGQFVGLSTACVSCHQKDFQTPVLNHISSGFPTTCETCHTMNSWDNAKYDHLKYTGFALTGVHATLACTACHINNVFQGTSATCYACHSADFASANNPPHLQLGFPRDCGMCHSTSTWLNATFNHSTTSFPLTGAHVTVTCAQCHVNNNYLTLPTNCYGCHQADFTQEPRILHTSPRVSRPTAHSATRQQTGARRPSIMQRQHSR
jgi:hypothetical protein